MIIPETITFKDNRLIITFITDLIYWIYDSDDDSLLLINLYNPKYDQYKVIFEYKTFLYEHLNKEFYEIIIQMIEAYRNVGST